MQKINQNLSQHAWKLTRNTFAEFSLLAQQLLLQQMQMAEEKDTQLGHAVHLQ